MTRQGRSQYHLKGVSALLGVSEEESASSPQEIEITAIKLPSSQPRRYFDSTKFQQLLESISLHGILEPLLVRPLKSSFYELVAGERRYRAAQELGFKKVPVVIKILQDEEALAVALAENLIREDINPLDEAEGMLKLLSLKLKEDVGSVISLLYRMSNEEKGNSKPNDGVNAEAVTVIKTVFDTLSVISWQSFVKNRLPLLKMPPDLLEALRAGKIEYTKAMLLSQIKQTAARVELLEEAEANDLSFIEVKERVKALKNSLSTDVNREEISLGLSLLNRYKEASNKLQKAAIWQNPKKQKTLEKLLSQIENLLAE